MDLESVIEKLLEIAFEQGFKVFYYDPTPTYRDLGRNVLNIEVDKNDTEYQIATKLIRHFEDVQGKSRMMAYGGGTYDFEFPKLARAVDKYNITKKQ
jgi:hypothetical protein